MNIEQALEQVYHSLHQNNEQLDAHIVNLKAALVAEGAANVEMEPARLPQNNRQGRKMLQTYFKKRGVVVIYTAQQTA